MRLDAMKTAFNTSPAALANLKSYGSDARAVQQISSQSSATEATTVTTATSWSLTEGGQHPQADDGLEQLDGRHLLSGTTYAYLLCKADWNSGKSAIDKLHRRPVELLLSPAGKPTPVRGAGPESG